MKRIWVSLVAAGLLAIAAVAPVSAQDSVTVDLEEVDGSGVQGNVRIESQDGEATVTILLTEGLEDESEHPVHIHEGTCDDLGDVAYPLNNIVDGSSETTIDVDVADLRTGDFAVNAHQSEDEIDTFIACGDIPAAVGGEAEDDEGDEAAAEDEGSDASDDDQAAEEDGDDAAEDDEGAGEDEAGADDSEDATDEDEGTEDTDDEAADDEEAEDSDDQAADGEDAEESDDEADQDDEAMEDDEAQDDIAPATGSTGGVDSDMAAMGLMLLAGGGLGAGMLLRRRATQVQRS